MQRSQFGFFDRLIGTKKKESIFPLGIGAAMGAGVLAFSAMTASAAVVCTGNTCWHSTEKYDYPPDARVTIHEDTWKAGPSITFREHAGRGYWAGETWKEW